MRKMMMGLALAASTVAVMPASAQRYDDGYRGDRYDQRYDDRSGNGYGRDTLRRASMMLDRAIQRRDLSQREVYYYRTELNRLYQLDARYRRDGYSRWEREQIEDRARRLIERLRDERRDDRWDDRRGYDRWDR
jgi:hypothetical protein